MLYFVFCIYVWSLLPKIYVCNTNIDACNKTVISINYYNMQQTLKQSFFFVLIVCVSCCKLSRLYCCRLEDVQLFVITQTLLLKYFRHIFGYRRGSETFFLDCFIALLLELFESLGHFVYGTLERKRMRWNEQSPVKLQVFLRTVSYSIRE